MKIKYEKMQVLLIDEVTKDRWIVEFTGTHGNLEGRVYKNEYMLLPILQEVGTQIRLWL